MNEPNANVAGALRRLAEAVERLERAAAFRAPRTAVDGAAEVERLRAELGQLQSVNGVVASRLDEAIGRLRAVVGEANGG